MDPQTFEPERTDTYWDNWGLVFLWLSIVAGPAAWAVNQLIGYALVKPLCGIGFGFGVSLVALAAFLMPAFGGWFAWRAFRHLRNADLQGSRVEDRSLFLAVAGISLNALLGLLILTSAAQPFFLSPCE